MSDNANDMKTMLNQIYFRLNTKRAALMHGLFHRVFELESGFYNGHYHKAANGEYAMDSYPIPVISVKGYCDVEIDLDAVSVSTKLRRDQALTYSFDKFRDFKFEAFGVEDYLADYYHEGNTLEDMKKAISQCNEKEIGFAFFFDFSIGENEMYEFVKLLRREGFYY